MQRLKKHTVRVCSSCAAMALAGGVAAQDCTPRWESVEQGTSWMVYAMAVYEERGQPALFVKGGFTFAGGIRTGPVARWDGAGWSAVGDVEFNNTVKRSIVFDDGSGPALYIGGYFGPTPELDALSVARWDGNEWSALGQGLRQRGYGVTAFEVYDDGGGPQLYAAGGFTITRLGLNSPRLGIARWTGTQWEPVGGDHVIDLDAIVAFDDGAGPSLFVTGNHREAPGQPFRCAGRWDGASWHDIRAGWDCVLGPLFVFDSGSGPQLYLAGILSQPPSSPRGLFRWTGEAWTTVATISGNSRLRFPRVWDDGTGEAAYFSVSGTNPRINGQPVSRIVRWDGDTWESLPTEALEGHGTFTFAGFDDAGGRALYAGGFFNELSRHIVRY